MPLLDEFSEQPRDMAWPGGIEVLLESFLTYAGRDNYLKRIIGCCVDLCALEVVVPYQFLLGEVENDPVLIGEIELPMEISGSRKVRAERGRLLR